MAYIENWSTSKHDLICCCISYCVSSQRLCSSRYSSLQFIRIKHVQFDHLNFPLITNKCPFCFCNTGLVGLSISYALALTSTQIFLSRWYCNLLNCITSVERIKQFMTIPPEPPLIIENNRPPTSWPPKGEIKLQKLKVKILTKFLCLTIKLTFGQSR